MRDIKWTVFRKIKRLIRSLFSFGLTLVIIFVGGRFVLSNVKTDNGVSLYNVITGTVEIGLDSAEANGTVNTKTVAKSGTTQLVSQAEPQPASPEAGKVQTTSEETSAANENVSVSSKDGYSTQALDLINQNRANAGLAPLTWNSAAAAAARTRAEEIVSKFSHTRPSGASGLTALNESGASYTRAGENIAAGQDTAGEAVNAWMNSPNHRANILKPEFTQTGIVCIYIPGSEYGYYWVQLFIG